MGESAGKRYKIICPYCGRVQYAAKSVFHELGVSRAGHGVCLKCTGEMRLVFHGETDSMAAEEWKSAEEQGMGISKEYTQDLAEVLEDLAERKMHLLKGEKQEEV